MKFVLDWTCFRSLTARSLLSNTTKDSGCYLAIASPAFVSHSEWHGGKEEAVSHDLRAQGGACRWPRSGSGRAALPRGARAQPPAAPDAARATTRCAVSLPTSRASCVTQTRSSASTSSNSARSSRADSLEATATRTSRGSKRASLKPPPRVRGAQGHRLLDVARGWRAGRSAAAGGRPSGRFGVAQSARAAEAAQEKSCSSRLPSLEPSNPIARSLGMRHRPTTLPSVFAHPGDRSHRAVRIVAVGQHDLAVGEQARPRLSCRCSCPRNG